VLMQDGKLARASFPHVGMMLLRCDCAGGKLAHASFPPH
jgi:hypothetical protein